MTFHDEMLSNVKLLGCSWENEPLRFMDAAWFGKVFLSFFDDYHNLQHFTEGEWLAFQLRDDFVPCFEACPLLNSNLPPASAQVAQAMLAQGGRVNVEVGCLVMDP